MNLVELTEYLVKSLVKNTDNVKVTMTEENGINIEVLVDESDIGAVIGRSGNIANSIRTIVQAAAYTNDQGRVRVNIDSNK